MRGLILAIQFMTRLPTPGVMDFHAEKMASAARWFPLVGLLLGALVTGAAWLGARVDPWLGALLGLAAWIWVTGALHLDGLSDLADALGAAHRQADPVARRERLLIVLGDPHVGVFGVVAVVMQLIAKLVLLMLLLRHGQFLVLLLIPAWARWGVLVWARLPAIKPGLGERFSWEVDWKSAPVWAVLLALASWETPALLVAPLFVLAWRDFLLRALGGQSGDALGAGVEWVESLLLLAVVIGGFLRGAAGA